MRYPVPIALVSLLVACSSNPTAPAIDPCTAETLAEREVVSKIKTKNYTEIDGWYIDRWLVARDGARCYVGPHVFAATELGQKTTCSWGR